MERKYQINGEIYDTVYFYARIKASSKNPDLKNREKASVLLETTYESLKSYEYGKTPVPAKVVVKMCDIYHDPDLCKEHCKYYCPMGEIFGNAYNPSVINVPYIEIDRLTIQLLNSFRSISSIKESLVEIVADGVITDDEKPHLDKILETLDAISQHAQELRAWTNKHLRTQDRKSL